MIYRRAHPRNEIRLPCLVRTQDGEFSSYTSDVSLGGVGVEMPSFLLMLRDARVTAVTIADLPALPVEVRWRSTRRFGARFIYPDRARPFVVDLLDRLADGKEPVSFPTG